MPDEVPEWTWDRDKAHSNQRKHRVSFAEAVVALEDPLALTIPDETRSEERLVTIGQASQGAILVVVWTPRGGGGRIVSARMATRRERRAYEQVP